MADGVFVQTNFANSHFPKYIRKNATVIYNPVTFDQDKIGMALRHDKRKEIVSVTRLNKQKNVPMLLRSFCEFRKTHPDYVLTVYGEGEERSALEQLAISLQLTDCVSFPGVKKNIHELIAGASIFAMASNFEGMSNSLIEAMCLGLPCVSTRVSGATDLIVDGVNGFLINLNDETALTISLCKLADDSELSHNFGIKASELYSKLNVDEISKQWIAGIEKYIC
jgi:glycosyltransferase involved in cell wall biosynthesis